LSNFLKHYHKISTKVFFFGLSLIIISLFFSRFLISIGFFIILFNWMLERDFNKKRMLFNKNKIGISIVLILLIHIVGLIHTQNLDDGIFDIKIKLPFLFILVYGTSQVHTKNGRDKMLILYLVTVLVSSIVAIIGFIFIHDYIGLEDLSEIALVGGNIQQAYFVNFALVIVVYFLFFSGVKLLKFRLALYISGVWLLCYLFILNALTGYLVLGVLFLYHAFFLIHSKKIKFGLAIISVGLLVLLGFYFNKVSSGFSVSNNIHFQDLPTHTANGNAYEHDTIRWRTENGNIIDIYFCEKEMRKGWEKISELSYDDKDLKDQQLSETLKRYLSSKNLKKDSVGLSGLSSRDVKYIESGCANYMYTNKFSIEARIHFVLWQLNTYYRTGIADNQSISQRIVFYKAALFLIKNNFWFGVGSGDVVEESKAYFEKFGSGLSEKNYNRVHNQFVVELVALGVFGFLAFIFLLFYPYFKNRKWNDYLLTSFYLIIIASFLTDNLFETQLGMSFFTVFYDYL